MKTPPITEQSLLDEFKKHPKIKLMNAYGGFIAGWPWEWFVTLTFKTDVAPEQSFKSFRRWGNSLNRELYGRRESLYWVVATERTKAHRVHLHALVSGVRNARRLTWMDRWTSLNLNSNGWARIEPIEDEKKVSHYITKYVAKDGEIYFSPNLKGHSDGLF